MSGRKKKEANEAPKVSAMAKYNCKYEYIFSLEELNHTIIVFDSTCVLLHGLNT